ncbi:MAG: restriction endonuclease subunit S [Stenomitos rutilans HA7619-LM2]|jgi:type I restriction enzyme S subunit|nr:restriction endonuclease subunit S [Stenomitos rutilans HA7619-LM2]
MTEGNGEARELPKGWCWVCLQEISQSITDGDHQPPPKSEQGIPFIVISNIRNHKIDFSVTKFVSNTYYEKIQESRKPRKGDILYTVTGSFGIPCLIDFEEKFCFQRHIGLIRLKEEVSRKYVFYLLRSPVIYQQAQKVATGTAQKTVSLAVLRNFEIPLPPFFEQNRIVDKIEELFSDVDQGVESLKTAQKQLKVYRQAVLKWAFEGKLTEAWRTQHQSTLKTGEALLAEIKAERENRYQQQLAEWETAVKEWEAIGKVGKKPQRPQKYKDPSPISKSQTSGSPSIPVSWLWTNLEQLKEFSLYGPRFSSQDYVDDGIPIARTTDISSSGKVDLKYAPKISLSDQEFEKYKLIKGDLLLTRTGSIGTNAVFHLTEKAIPGAFLIHYRLLPSLNIWFIFYFLESPEAQQHFFKKSSGVGRPNLNVPSIEELIIPLPSLEEQEQIVEEIESRLSICDQLEATIIENLQKAEALRQSILKQAFEGKLVPQDPNDEPAETLLERIKAERLVNGNTGKKSKPSHQQLTLQEL